MTQSFPAWPPGNTFPASQRDTLDRGAPDFPNGAGGREMGKFRPSTTPALTTVAVVGDDGGPVVGVVLNALLEEMILELRAIRVGITLLLNLQDDQNDHDLIEFAAAETDVDSV